MTHPTPLKLSMHADEALPPNEAEQVAAHVEACELCQSQLSALRAETQHLVTALRADTPEDAREVPTFSRPASLRGFALANIGTALLIWLAQFLWKTLFGEMILNTATWLTSVYIPDIYQLTSTTALYLLEEGTAMLDAYLGFVIATLLIITALALLLMRQRFRAGTLSVCLIAAAVGTLMVPAPVQALDFRRSEGVLTIPASETIDDTLIVRGETVLIEGTITGDVIAFGEEINVTGSIRGNLFTFAEIVKVRGDVGGLVLGAANTYTLSTSSVGGDLWLAGENIEVGGDVRIGRNVAIASDNVSVGADVGRDLFAYAETVDMSGNLGGNLEAFSQRLRLLGDAHIVGNVRFRGNEAELFRADEVRVDGDVEFLARPEEKNRYATVEFYLWQIAQLIAAFLFGLAMLWLVPALRGLSIGAGLEGLKSAGIGIVALVSVPIIAVLVAITLIGLPFTFLALVAWLLGIYLATIVVGASIGQMLVSNSDSMPLTLLAGLATVMVVVNLPVIGGIIGFIFTIIGLGMLVQLVFDLVSTRGFDEQATD
jgi:cytoskeletal protein CcmA (bactofilin family)